MRLLAFLSVMLLMPLTTSAQLKEGIVREKEANPKFISVRPAPCPRLGKEESGLMYYGEEDRFNHTPFFQLLDPDIKNGKQKRTFSDMDGKNVLLLSHVRLTYDYEDTKIIDYDGPNPLTGKHEVIHEGEGGFYANIHYAIVPYRKDVLKMDRQTLLHFAEGKLNEIDKENLAPELRVHSFIPGPFLSKEDNIYAMCEWGDTAYQEPEQNLDYREMALWDWDYPVTNPGHILLIVWEGDEEDWLIRDQLIHPFYLTDDLIGVFEIWREKSLKPLTLKNARDDFEITVATDNLSIPPR